jgi:hypothetical protein
MQIDGTISRLSTVSDNVILLHIVNYKCIHIFEAYIEYIILCFFVFQCKINIIFFSKNKNINENSTLQKLFVRPNQIFKTPALVAR